MALSKTQTKRLGCILNVMFGDEIPSKNLTELITSGFVELNGNNYVLTKLGKSEKNRLCTLAGLNIMYKSEKS